MKATDHSISGLILAAGAGERIGEPKAMLELADRTTLLRSQKDVLAESGCTRVLVVTGAADEHVRGVHADLDVTWVHNEEWETGQFSSLKAGVDNVLETNESGVIVLPVDAAGVRPDTVGSIIETALRNQHLDVIIPEFQERGGHPVYLSRGFCERIAGIDSAGDDARLDAQIRKTANVLRLPVNDPGVIRNINTPEEWKKHLNIKS